MAGRAEAFAAKSEERKFSPNVRDLFQVSTEVRPVEFKSKFDSSATE
jgi:hypothetical protein